MDEIRDTGMAIREVYSPQEYFHFSKRVTAKKNLVADTLTELPEPRNEEVRRLRKS
jgi:hypothetical protein